MAWTAALHLSTLSLLGQPPLAFFGYSTACATLPRTFSVTQTTTLRCDVVFCVRTWSSDEFRSLARALYCPSAVTLLFFFTRSCTIAPQSSPSEFIEARKGVSLLPPLNPRISPLSCAWAGSLASLDRSFRPSFISLPSLTNRKAISSSTLTSSTNHCESWDHCELQYRQIQIR